MNRPNYAMNELTENAAHAVFFEIEVVLKGSLQTHQTYKRCWT